MDLAAGDVILELRVLQSCCALVGNFTARGARPLYVTPDSAAQQSLTAAYQKSMLGTRHSYLGNAQWRVCRKSQSLEPPSSVLDHFVFVRSTRVYATQMSDRCLFARAMTPVGRAGHPCSDNVLPHAAAPRKKVQF